MAFYQCVYPSTKYLFAPLDSMANPPNAHGVTHHPPEPTTTPKPTTPAAVVSVNMLTSPTPGLIAQMTRVYTYHCNLHATVYVDQSAVNGFIWLQKSLYEVRTSEQKLAFERHCRSFNVNISHYYADDIILLPLVGNFHATTNTKQSLMLWSTPITRTVWQNAVFESYKTWREQC
jgi:hypothetical protein